MLERWPQVYHVKITFTALPSNRFISTTKNLMKCVVNWIPLRICVRSRFTQPQLRVQFGWFARAFLEESSSQSISSNSSLWKRTNCSVVIQTWSSRGKSAASTQALAAAGKRRALAFYFSVRICCMFLISKCRGYSDLGLCMTSVLAKRMLLRSADESCGQTRLKIDESCGQTRFKIGSRHCAAAFSFKSTEVMHSLSQHRPRSNSPLHFDIRNI